MEQKPKQSTENFIKDIRRKSRRLFSSEQKLIIVMEAQRGENSVTEICRKHGISQATFYKWNKEFMEAGKKRLSGDTTREATSDEVAELRRLNKELKELVADLLLDNNILKKSIDRLA
jgi:transposase